MVEIRYGYDYEVADLAGKSVGEARERFQAEFGIPEKARAKLNGKKVKERLEPEIRLSDDDKLSFAEARGKGVFLIGAMLLALAITGGIFAFAATSTTVGLTLTGDVGDFVSASANASPPTWSVFGKYKGVTDAGGLFTITPATGFTGDLAANVLLANADELVDAYRVLVMKISVYKSNDSGGGGANTSAQVGTSEYLTLGKGEINIDLTGISGLTANQTPLHVYLDSGFYITYGTGWGVGSEDPTLLLDVAQKGT